MKIENLEVGKTYKNYKVICEILTEPINSGKSKQLQISNWNRYFSYDRDGNKFTITEIFKNPIKKEDKRCEGNNRVKESLVKSNPSLADEWLAEENGMELPKTITRRSTEHFWWLCSKCNNKILASPVDRLKKEKNISDASIRCPYCSLSKNAKIIYNFLTKYGINFKLEYIFPDLKGINEGYLRFDFAVFCSGKLLTLIEYDGEYHEEELNPDQDNYKIIKTHDDLKNKYCKENNVPLLRISYLDEYNINQILKKELSKYSLFNLEDDLKMGTEFKLMSINVIAYLKMKNIKPIRIEKTEEGNVAHYFKDTDELHFYLKEYKKDKYIQSFITHLIDTRKQIKSLV